MVSAVGSSPTFNPSFNTTSTTAASTAGIEAQIARDQKELANCVNCASAETKQGQADIQALTNKISVAKARLEQITAANPADQAIAVNLANASDATAGINAESETVVRDTAASDTETNESVANSNAVATIAEGNANADSAAELNASDSGAGRFVNEYV